MKQPHYRCSVTGCIHANTLIPGVPIAGGLSVGQAVKVPGLEFSIILAIIPDLVVTPF